jgi:hypothetical protein
MGLDEDDVNRYLQQFFGRYEDSYQEAWVEILEGNPRTINEITPIVRRVRNRAIKRFLEKKYREDSLYKPLGNEGNGTFTLESVLESQAANERNDERNDGFCEKVVDFLIGEYLGLRNENLALRKKEVELKAERLRLREESLTFRRDRFDSWRRLMEEKGRQEEHRASQQVQLQREKIELRKEQLLLKEKRLMSGGAVSAPAI